MLITTIFNSILRLCYFPAIWKHAQIIMLAKPGKPPTQSQFYRPISLLSKVLEKLLLTRIKKSVDLDQMIPCHQFEFRESHSTIHQSQRIVTHIMESLEEKKICTAVFLEKKNRRLIKFGTRDYYTNLNCTFHPNCTLFENHTYQTEPFKSK